MQIIQHELPRASDEPGVQRVHVAGPDLGAGSVECWLLTLAPQAFSQGRQEDGEQVFIVLSGVGKLILTGAPQRFTAPCTLVLPTLTDYRLVSQGVEPLQVLTVRARRPSTDPENCCTPAVNPVAVQREIGADD